MAHNKQGNTAKVPALRFPGFTDEWEKFQLKDIITCFSGGTPISSKPEYYNGDIPFIRSGEISENSTELFLSELGLKNSSAKIVEIGDILLALYGATSGQISIAKLKGAINQAILCIRTDMNARFLCSVWAKHASKILQSYLQGGQGNLSAEIVKNLSFYFPSSHEQQRISMLIERIDERITTQSKIIEQLQSLIGGLNDVIFNSFDRYCSLQEIDNQITSGKDKIANGTVPLFGSTGQIGKISSPSFNEQLVLVARVGSIGNVQLVNIPCGVSDNTIVIRCGAKAKYVYYCLKRYNFKRITSGTTQPLITASDVKRIKIPLISKEKETKIVEILDTFNSKLKVESSILKMLLKQKEFLLSNLFI